MCGSSSAVRFELTKARQQNKWATANRAGSCLTAACERRMQKGCSCCIYSARFRDIVPPEQSLIGQRPALRCAPCSWSFPAALTWLDWEAHRCCQMFVYVPWWRRAWWPPPINTQIVTKIKTFLFFPPLISCRCAGTSACSCACPALL